MLIEWLEGNLAVARYQWKVPEDEDGVSAEYWIRENKTACQHLNILTYLWFDFMKKFSYPWNSSHILSKYNHKLKLILFWFYLKDHHKV